MGILEQIEARLERIEARLAKCGPVRGSGTFVDQRSSPLGRRRHCAAARRLIAEGDGRAFISGRRHLLTEDAVAEELARLSLVPANEAEGESESAYERAMARALGAEKG